MFVRNLKDINIRDIVSVGGKAANLGELCAWKVNVPKGFCITYAAYEEFVKVNRINESIQFYLDENLRKRISLDQCSECIIKCFLDGSIPNKLGVEIIREYRTLGKNAAVAIRSSASTEDLEESSFAGQQDTFLNISGDYNVFQHVKRCWASLWSPRAIDYRKKREYENRDIYMAVLVQRMIRPDAAGVVFTCNPVNFRREEMLINSSYGLGEAVVSGTVSPDTYFYNTGKKRITYRKKGKKEYRYINSDSGIKKILNSSKMRNSYSLNYLNVWRLVKVCKKIECRFGGPQDIEWGIAGGKIYILQSRPVTSMRSGTT
ncbi:PEP/pyruvate-binding domain-containing protein [Lachnospiraceae bacterium 54-53]